jgi:hypothetical protein
VLPHCPLNIWNSCHSSDKICSFRRSSYTFFPLYPAFVIPNLISELHTISTVFSFYGRRDVLLLVLIKFLSLILRVWGISQNVCRSCYQWWIFIRRSGQAEGYRMPSSHLYASSKFGTWRWGWEWVDLNSPQCLLGAVGDSFVFTNKKWTISQPAVANVAIVTVNNNIRNNNRV